jgi:hypothetical protein
LWRLRAACKWRNGSEGERDEDELEEVEAEVRLGSPATIVRRDVETEAGAAVAGGSSDFLSISGDWAPMHFGRLKARKSRQWHCAKNCDLKSPLEAFAVRTWRRSQTRLCSVIAITKLPFKLASQLVLRGANLNLQDCNVDPISKLKSFPLQRWTASESINWTSIIKPSDYGVNDIYLFIYSIYII